MAQKYEEKINKLLFVVAFLVGLLAIFGFVQMLGQYPPSTQYPSTGTYICPPAPGEEAESTFCAAEAEIPASRPAQIGMHVLNPPQYSMLGAEPSLFYELYVSNYTPPALYRVEVLENGPAGAVLQVVEGDGLNASLRPPKSGVSDYAVFMLVDLGSARPSSVYHKLYFNRSGAIETSVGGQAVVNYSAPVIISPPVRGSDWLAAEAPSNFNHHREAIITLQGTARVPERYAIDWMRYGQNGKLFKTNGATNEDYYCYNESLYAVADGTVVDVKDGIPENAPWTKPPITIAWAGGNYVMLDIGGGFYAFYAHMVPGSISVKIGDKVKKGDVLGRLGNSGNSDAPHLHFHVDNGKDALFSEGMPYAFASYGLQGNADWIGLLEGNGSWTGAFQSQVQLNMTMPVNGDVLDFGNG